MNKKHLKKIDSTNPEKEKYDKIVFEMIYDLSKKLEQFLKGEYEVNLVNQDEKKEEC